MGLGDKFDEIKGAAKEKLGDATDDRRTQAEGNIEKNTAKAKQGAENFKEGVQDRVDGDDAPRA